MTKGMQEENDEAKNQEEQGGNIPNGRATTTATGGPQDPPALGTSAHENAGLECDAGSSTSGRKSGSQSLNDAMERFKGRYSEKIVTLNSTLRADQGSDERGTSSTLSSSEAAPSGSVKRESTADQLTGRVREFHDNIEKKSSLVRLSTSLSTKPDELSRADARKQELARYESARGELSKSNILVRSLRDKTSDARETQGAKGQDNTNSTTSGRFEELDKKTPRDPDGIVLKAPKGAQRETSSPVKGQPDTDKKTSQYGSKTHNLPTSQQMPNGSMLNKPNTAILTNSLSSARGSLNDAHILNANVELAPGLGLEYVEDDNSSAINSTSAINSRRAQGRDPLTGYLARCAEKRDENLNLQFTSASRQSPQLIDDNISDIPPVSSEDALEDIAVSHLPHVAENDPVSESQSTSHSLDLDDSLPDPPRLFPTLLQAWAVDDKSSSTSNDQREVYVAEIMEDKWLSRKKILSASIAILVVVAIAVIVSVTVPSSNRNSEEVTEPETGVSNPKPAIVDCASGFKYFSLLMEQADENEAFVDGSVFWQLSEQCSGNIHLSDDKIRLGQCIPDNKYHFMVEDVRSPFGTFYLTIVYDSAVVLENELVEQALIIPVGAPDGCACGQSLLSLQVWPDLSGLETNVSINDRCTSESILRFSTSSSFVNNNRELLTGTSISGGAGIIISQGNRYNDPFNITQCIPDSLGYSLSVTQRNNNGRGSFLLQYDANEFPIENISNSSSNSIPFGVDVICDNCTENQKLFSFDLNVDGHGFDIGWYLTKHDCFNSETILQGSEYNSFESISVVSCLDDGFEYIFTLYDFSGDGLCCQNGVGSYEVSYDEEILAKGNSFRYVDSVRFPGRNNCRNVNVELDCPEGETLFSLEMQNDLISSNVGWTLVENCTRSSILNSSELIYFPYEYVRQTQCIEDVAMTFTLFNYITKGLGENGFFSLSLGNGDKSFWSNDFGNFKQTSYGNSTCSADLDPYPCEEGYKLFSLDVATTFSVSTNGLGWTLLDACSFSVVESGTDYSDFEGDRIRLCIPDGEYLFQIYSRWDQLVCCVSRDDYYVASYDGEIFGEKSGSFFDSMTIGNESRVCETSVSTLCEPGEKFFAFNVLLQGFFGDPLFTLIDRCTFNAVLSSTTHRLRVKSNTISACLPDGSYSFHVNHILLGFSMNDNGYHLSYGGERIQTGTNDSIFDSVSFGSDEKCDHSDFSCPSGLKPFLVDILPGEESPYIGWNLVSKCSFDIIVSRSNFTILEPDRVFLCLEDEEYILTAWNNESYVSPYPPSGLTRGWYSVSYDGEIITSGEKLISFNTTTFGTKKTDCSGIVQKNCQRGEKTFSFYLEPDPLLDRLDSIQWKLISDCTHSTALSSTSFTLSPASVATCIPIGKYTFVNDAPFSLNGKHAISYDGEVISETDRIDIFGKFELGEDSDCSDLLKGVCPSGQKLFSMEIVVDNGGDLVGWSLIDDCSLITVFSNYSYPSHEGETLVECIPDGSYTFIIYDNGDGDGICCTDGKGWYEVLYNGDVVQRGGEFNNFELAAFGKRAQCIESVPDCPPGNKLFSLDLLTINESGENVYWNVLDSCNLDVVISANYSLYGTDRVHHCLPEGEYIFSIHGEADIRSGNRYTVVYDGLEISTGSFVSFVKSVTFGDKSKSGCYDSCLPGLKPLNLLLNLDSFPGDNRWSLSSCSELVYSGDGANAISSNKIFYTTCLDENDSYVFSLEDSYGDGISCNEGNITLVYDSQLIGLGCEFGNFIEWGFGRMPCN